MLWLLWRKYLTTLWNTLELPEQKASVKYCFLNVTGWQIHVGPFRILIHDLQKE